MFAICQTSHPATTVEHSIECHFYDLDSTNLVTAGANQLNVYKITNGPKYKLEFVQSFELYGTVASMEKVSLGNRTNCRRDSLVLSFHDAKLSIVEYNPEIHDLKTISMHYFEDENLRDGCVTNHMYPPQVRVDPENRCVAMLIYGRYVVVIPLDKDEEEDLEHELYNTSSSGSSSEDESMAPFDQSDLIQQPIIGQVVKLKPAVTPSFKSPVLPSYKIDLSEETCGEKIDNIVDIQFLHNYNDPTLVILHEPTRTWSGRVAMRQDTFSMVALSMNVHQRLQPIIWTVNNLPYDCLRILPVPKPIGGLLILACNELIYLNQSVPAFGMSFNSFTKDSSTFPLNDKDEQGNKIDYINISLDLSQAVFLNHNKILFILKDGDVYLVTLFNDDMRSIKNFHFKHIASTVQPNCLTLCENNLLFIGSHVGDSVLAEIVGDLKESNGQLDAYDAYDDGDSLMSTDDIKESIHLEEHDKLLSSSASGRICYGEAPNVSENLPYNHRDPYVELITTAGHHKNGSICVFQRTIKPHVQDTYDGLRDCSDLFTVISSISTTTTTKPKTIKRPTMDDGEEVAAEAEAKAEAKIEAKVEDEVVVKIEPMGEEEVEAMDEDEVVAEVDAKSEAEKDAKFEAKVEANVEEEEVEVEVKVEIESRLLLNRANDTKVFSTKGELVELRRDECAFDTSEPTLLATNIGHKEKLLILQVMSTGAQLISNDKIIHHVKWEGKICDVCVSDPHIVALTKGGSIYHLQLRCSTSDFETQDNSQQYCLSWHDIGAPTNGHVISLSLYKDTSGLFRCTTGLRTPEETAEPTYWLLVVDDRGVLEIFSVPDFQLVYSVDNFPSAPIILADNVKLFVTDLDLTISKTREILMCGLGKDNRKPILFVRSQSELVLYEAYKFTEVDINNHLKIRFKKINTLLLDTILPAEYTLESQRRHLDQSQDDSQQRQQEQQLAITDGRNRNRSSHYSSGNGSNSNNNSRNNNNNNPKHHTSNSNNNDVVGKSSNSNSKSGTHGKQLGEQLASRHPHWLRAFHGLGEYNGVFLAGTRPHWFIMTERGTLRVHPMNAEGSIYAFSQFDNENFIYFTENKELRIAKLSTHLSLDSHWPLKKLTLNETVHFVNYHVERKIYCVVTSCAEQCLKIMKVGSEPDTMKIEDLERENGYIPPTTEKFKLRLYDPENWELIPDCEIEFEEWEQVTCVKNVSLASEGTTSGLKGYIAISTNYCYGEDVPNRGRIWILDLIEVVPEPDRPLTKNKIKKVYCQEQKGPVTTLSHTCGLLMSAVGQKIYLWQLKEEQLDGVAFIDTQIYIHCASSVKNLILVSDVCKSISLLRYQQETRTLSMVCRDSKPLEVFACDFAVDNELLNFVVADSEKNIIIYAYDPKHEDSHGGTRLLRRADYHLGAHVTSFCRLRGKVPSALANNQSQALYWRRKHITMFCTVDGAIGYLYPIDEPVYRQFQILQNEMTIALPHPAGLNPKAWRSVKQARPSIPNPCKLILDGDIINRFLTLSVKERNELTKKIGTTTEKILADIQLIQESTMYF